MVLAVYLISVDGGEAYCQSGANGQQIVPIKITGPKPALIASLNGGQGQVIVIGAGLRGTESYGSCGPNGGAMANARIATIKLKRSVSYTICAQGASNCDLGMENLHLAAGATKDKVTFVGNGAGITLTLKDCVAALPKATKK